jgi:hypothetical protein
MAEIDVETPLTREEALKLVRGGILKPHERYTGAGQPPCFAFPHSAHNIAVASWPVASGGD